MITDISGVRVGHWTDADSRTGCTVVLLPGGTAASGEVRGGAPATREWALLEVGRLVQQVDAVVLTGGSAFGLATADGVARWCRERGAGFPTTAGPVPIVVALALYDLGVAAEGAYPGAAEGYAACVAATSGDFAVGQVGAGTGATVGKIRGSAATRPGGVGTASLHDGALLVGALVAVNAVGDVRTGADPPPPVDIGAKGLGLGEQTTIGVLATNARLDKAGCRHLAGGGHDGYARALEPVHTTFDGDAIVAAATGVVDAHPDHVRMLGARAMETAIRSALHHDRDLFGGVGASGTI